MDTQAISIIYRHKHGKDHFITFCVIPKEKDGSHNPAFVKEMCESNGWEYLYSQNEKDIKRSLTPGETKAGLLRSPCTFFNLNGDR